jgi:agmatine deiminase
MSWALAGDGADNSSTIKQIHNERMTSIQTFTNDARILVLLCHPAKMYTRLALFRAFLPESIKMQLPLRFEYVPYPLWRRKLPAPVALAASVLLQPFYPVRADRHPPATPTDMADLLSRWGLLPRGVTRTDTARALDQSRVQVETAAADTTAAISTQPIRLPAQWEGLESVLLRFPVLYPPLWPTHAAMIAAIARVAQVSVVVPAPSWPHMIAHYLCLCGMTNLDQVRFLHIPTDDIWIRDYGPFVGYTADDSRAAVDALFDPLGRYPQQQDDALPTTWAAHEGLAVHKMNFHTEGGNYWSDGLGTLLVSDEMLARHPHMNKPDIEAALREAFSFEKLIILPRLLHEETGHVDLVCKLASATTVLINRPNGTLNDSRLREAAALLRSETNAQGQPYEVIDLPFPPFYRNWGLFNIWRTYTNSLTVNGRVLVPVFGLAEDEEALHIYRTAMPNHEVIPIDCRVAANGGGGVHCLTKEVPVARR